MKWFLVIHLKVTPYLGFCQKNDLKNLIVVADIEMNSNENVKLLVETKINYIVVVRLGNFSTSMRA